VAYTAPIRGYYWQASQDAPKVLSAASLALPLLKRVSFPLFASIEFVSHHISQSMDSKGGALVVCGVTVFATAGMSEKNA